MKNNIPKINSIFIKMMMYSLIAQLLILCFFIFVVRGYVNQSQTNMISDDLLIKDRYTIDKIGQYEILESKYALDLELHNLGDMRNLDSIKFIPVANTEISFINCDILDSKKFKLCKTKNGAYLGVSAVTFNNKFLGYLLLEKKYTFTFPVPVRYDLFLILLSVIGIFVINFGLIFIPLKKKIANNTKYLMDFISSQDFSKAALSHINIDEYRTIALTVIEERNEIFKLQQEISYDNARKNIAAQVAHDIRSPLTAINIAISDIASIPENRRVMIKNASKRINDIANNLLAQYVNNAKNTNTNVNTVSSEIMYFVLDNIVSEKNYEYHQKPFKILLDCTKEAYSCFAKINLAVFKRILSNLINNSIEAISSNGFVKIWIDCDANFIELTLTDNGHGIPMEILPKIAEEGFSFGKKAGAGLGLFYTKQHIENINGYLTIQSEVDVGTIVTIKLPRADIPLWFCEKLIIKPDYKIAILDDDASIHDAWVERFSQFHNVKIFHFSKASGLIKHKNLTADMYLVDYELLTESLTGLDVIENLRLNHCAILVTNCFEDSIVRTRCKTMKVKIIPKPYVQFIPIIYNNIINNETIVFIDDDESMRLTWLFAAEQAGISVDVYPHPNDFTRQSVKYHENTVIYIDSELGENLSGEIYAKEFYEKGFKQIHLATGHPAEKFSNLPWLKSIVGKTPPF